MRPESPAAVRCPCARLWLAAAIVTTLTGTACSSSASEFPSAPAEAASAQASAPAQSAVAFDAARAWEHLKRQVAFGPRPSGSPALLETRRYLLAQLKAAGIDAVEQPFVGKTPLGEVAMANVIGTIPGKRRERLALASHYDTKLFKEFQFVGANDGASSTAALLELGRVLKTRTNEFTIELIFLDGEEARMTEWRGLDNTYGSRHYAEAATKDGSIKSLKALVLLDMVGDRDLVVRRESYSTPWLVDILWSTAARLGHTATFSNQLTTVEDDHVAFLRAGVAAADIIDLDTPARRGTWHTAQDDLEHVSMKSLKIVGDVVLASIPDIEKHLATP